MFLGGGQASAVATAQEVPDGSLPFVAKVSVGDTLRACTGVLVDRRWILTAKSCFFDGTNPVVAGAPTQPTSVVLGRTDVSKVTGDHLAVVGLVPSADRDVVLAQLSAAVTDVTPVSYASSSAPQSGDTVTIAGYGRTADEWVPNRLHQGTFAVGAVSAGQFAVDGTSTLCKGDAGAPAFRDGASGPQLVGITTASGQKGCFGEPASTTQSGATVASTYDLGSWIKDTTLVLPDGLREPVTGEFNRDAYQDVIAADSAGVLWMYPGTATPGVWGQRVKVGNSGWNGMRAFAVGKVNRDGYDDLVAIESSTNLLWYYPGTAAGGAFGTRINIGSGWTTDFRDITIGRVNNDAYDDLLVVKSSTKQLLLYAGNATGGRFNEAVQAGTGWDCCTKLQLGKFNGDDYDDLMTVDSAAGTMRIYTGTAAGTTFTPAVDSGAGSGWNAASYIATGTFDGTGLDGLLEVDSATGHIYLHQRTTAGGWTGRVTPGGQIQQPGPGEMAQFVTGKFNRDAYTDLLGVDSAGVAWLYPGTAAKTFGPRVQIATGWGGLRELAVGHVNRDDYDDVVAIETSTNLLWYYPGTAAGGAFGTRVNIGSGWTTDFRDITIGKVDRDAYDDLLVVKTSTKQLLEYKGNAAGGRFNEAVQYGTGWDCCSELQLGRFNDDDYDDLQTVVTSSGKTNIYAGTAAGTQFTPAADTGAGTALASASNVYPITFGSDTRSGVLAKNASGALLLYPWHDGHVDYADPITFGPRD